MGESWYNQLLDRVASFIMISNSSDEVVVISDWNQINYLQILWNRDKSFQRLIETAAIKSLRCWDM